MAAVRSADLFFLLVETSEHADGERRGADLKGTRRLYMVETFPMPPLAPVIALGVRHRHAPKFFI